MHELLGGHKVLEVLVIGEDEYDMCRALQVVVPLSEGLEDGKQFLVIKSHNLALLVAYCMSRTQLDGCCHHQGRSGR